MRRLTKKLNHRTICTIVLMTTGSLLWWCLSGYLGGARLQAALLIAAGMVPLFFVFTRLERIATMRLVDKNWALAGENVRLMESLDEMEERFVASLRSIAEAVDAHDVYANGHSKRVANVAVKIGKKLNMSDKELKSLETAALFHDIGMIWVPPHILMKEQPLTADEQAAIRRHTVQGAELLDSVKSLKDEGIAVLHHHERFDGTGYPYGLKGLAIPLAARVLAVADAFDAMTSERPYRCALLMREALEELYSNAGGQFDPHVVEAFLNALDDITRENEMVRPENTRFGARLYSMVGNC